MTKKTNGRKNERTLVWKKENTLKGAIPNKPGLYKYYGKDGKLIYVGHARRLRHRVQSYMQKDCPCEHPTKVALRPKIKKVRYTVMPKAKAQALEKRLKKRAKYNVW
jgi:excinuclease ABC subunit C